jgi:hypothetical protein
VLRSVALARCSVGRACGQRSVDQLVKAMSRTSIISPNDTSMLAGMPNAPLASWATKAV